MQQDKHEKVRPHRKRRRLVRRSSRAVTGSKRKMYLALYLMMLILRVGNVAAYVYVFQDDLGNANGWSKCSENWSGSDCDSNPCAAGDPTTL